ncbi:MAG: NAD-dependent epimerase/dehydratase family protein [Segetibacter sp.]
MIKILITGGAGNVGGALAQRLIDNPNFHVVVVDNLATGKIDKLPFALHNNFKFIKADVNRFSDISSIMLAHKFDYVFHYAAMVGVKRTLAHPIKVLEDIEGIKNILSLSKNTGVKRIFYSSSSEVYGEPVEFPQNEHTTPLNSRLPYAIVKNVGEAFFKSYQQEYGLDYTVFRFFNTYGPNQSTDFVVPKFIALALQNKEITIYGEGNQTRTFCYINDNIDATVKIFEENIYINEVVNIGSDHEVSILKLAQLIIQIIGSQSVIKHLPPLEEGDMTRRRPDNSKMKCVLNRDLLPLEEGIRVILKEKFNIEVPTCPYIGQPS